MIETEMGWLVQIHIPFVGTVTQTWLGLEPPTNEQVAELIVQDNADATTQDYKDMIAKIIERAKNGEGLRKWPCRVAKSGR